MARRKLGDRVFGKYAIDDPVDVLHATWIKLEMAFFALVILSIVVGFSISIYAHVFDPSLLGTLSYHWQMFSLWVQLEAIRPMIYYGAIAIAAYVSAVFGIWILRPCLNLLSEIR